jgi:hypothetical protein
MACARLIQLIAFGAMCGSLWFYASSVADPSWLTDARVNSQTGPIPLDDTHPPHNASYAAGVVTPTFTSFGLWDQLCTCSKLSQMPQDNQLFPCLTAGGLSTTEANGEASYRDSVINITEVDSVVRRVSSSSLHALGFAFFELTLARSIQGSLRGPAQMILRALQLFNLWLAAIANADLSNKLIQWLHGECHLGHSVATVHQLELGWVGAARIVEALFSIVTAAFATAYLFVRRPPMTVFLAATLHLAWGSWTTESLHMFERQAHLTVGPSEAVDEAAHVGLWRVCSCRPFPCQSGALVVLPWLTLGSALLGGLAIIACGYEAAYLNRYGLVQHIGLFIGLATAMMMAAANFTFVNWASPRDVGSLCPAAEEYLSESNFGRGFTSSATGMCVFVSAVLLMGLGSLIGDRARRGIIVENPAPGPSSRSPST